MWSVVKRERYWEFMSVLDVNARCSEYPYLRDTEHAVWSSLENTRHA